MRAAPKSLGPSGSSQFLPGLEFVVNPRFFSHEFPMSETKRLAGRCAEDGEQENWDQRRSLRWPNDMCKYQRVSKQRQVSSEDPLKNAMENESSSRSQAIELLFMASYQTQKGQRSKQEFATRVLAKMLSLPTTDLDLACADYSFFRPNNV